jgi:hypothetical protein
MPFGPTTMSKSVFGFDPRTVAQCALWLDAADFNSFTLSPGTTNITAWRDKSQNARSFTATNSPVYTANYVNGNSAVKLTASATTNQYFQGSLVNTTNVVTVFCVAIMSSSTANPPTTYARLFSTNSAGTPADSSSGNIFIGRLDVNFQIYANSSGNGIPPASANFATVVANVPFMYSLNVNGTVAYSFFNGSPILALATSAANYSYTTLNIGRTSQSSANNLWDGYVCEFLVYNSVLNDQQRQQVEGYLAWKWGLVNRLPSTHPFSKNKIFARTFLPSDINGCVSWFDATDTSTVNLSGTTVVRWKDKSGNGLDATSAAGPTYTTDANGLQYMSFNGTSQFLGSSLTIPTHTHCLIAVWNPTTVSADTKGNTSLFRFQQGTYIVFPYMNGTTPRGYITNLDGAPLLAGASTLVENSVAGVTNMCMANIGPTSQQIYKNGVLQSSATQTLSAGTSFPFFMASFNGGGEFFEGRLYEMIIYNRQLNTSERQMIEAYLCWKFNLRGSLNRNNPFLAFPPSAPLPFLPTNIPNCVLWLDGADTSPTSMTFSAGTFTLTTWRDKSGNGNNATANSSPIYVPSSINGIGSIQLNNAPYFSGTFATTISGETVTCFVAASSTIQGTSVGALRAISLASSGTIADWNNPSSVTAIYADTGNSRISTYRYNRDLPGNTVGASVPFIASSQYDGDSGYMYTNGQASSTSGSNSSTGFFNITNYAIGRSVETGATDYWRGFVGEVIVYNSWLSSSERQFVEGYLSKKWNIRISDGGAFYRTTSSTYPQNEYADVSSNTLNLDCSLFLSGDSTLKALRGNAWTVYNAPTKTTTPGGSTAIVLDGVNEYLMDQTGIANPQAYTIEVWFYSPNNSQTVNIVSEMGQTGAPATGYNWTVIQLRNNQIQLGPYTYNNTAGLVVAKYVPNQWHHVVLTNSAGATTTNTASVLSGYVNGVLKNTAYYTRYAPGTSYYALGAPGNANFGYFNGRIGYLRIYSSVLNQTQIQQNYNNLCERFGLSILPTSFPQPVYSLDAYVNYYYNLWDTTTMFNYTSSGFTNTGGGYITFTAASSQYGLAPAGFASWPAFSIFVIVNFEPTAGSFERIIDFGNGAPSDNIIFCRNGTTGDARLEIYRGTTSAVTIGAAIVSGISCYCVTIRYDGTNSTNNFYVNNVLKTTQTVPTNNLPALVQRGTNYVGRSWWGADAYFSGTMSVVQLYNVELSAAQISTIYNRYKSRFSLP